MFTGASSKRSLPKAHLIGGDSQGWALDVDLRMTRQALAGVVDLVDSPFEASIIHSVNAEMLVSDPRIVAKLIPGKKIVAQFTSEPSRLFEDFPRLYEACLGWTCVAQSEEAFEGLSGIGLPDVRRIPYIAELRSFFPVARDDERLSALRAELGIPRGKYIIGSFVRDSLGVNLNALKPQKGADIFYSIVLGAAEKIGRDKIHVLLAGPRRHWLRKRLESAGISYTFDGLVTEHDDNPRNILPLARLNLLINLIDLYIIPSRWEGAPAGLFHVIACKKKIISNDIAAPRDVLEKKARFTSLAEAIHLVEDDFHANSLEAFVERNHRKVMAEHSPEALRPFWHDIYGSLGTVEAQPARFLPLKKLEYSLRHKVLWKPSVLARKLRKHARRRIGRSARAWGSAFAEEGPLKPLEGALRGGSFRFSEGEADVHLAGGVCVDPVRLAEEAGGKKLILWFADESGSLITPELSRRATAMAFSGLDSWRSAWSSGLRPGRGFIIRPIPDPQFFYPPPENRSLGERGPRCLIMLGDGAPEPRLAVESANLQRVHGGTPAARLGELLRESDLAIFLGGGDPALFAVRALACGTPVVYPAGSPAAALVGLAGEPYADPTEITAAVTKVLENFTSYVACAYVRPAVCSVGPVLEALEL